MKKTLVYLMITTFAAGLALAEGPRGDGQSKHQRKGDSRQRAPISEEQRGKMKAHHEAIQKLAEAARQETDEAKKAELVQQIRVKLNEGAEKMEAHFRKRLEKAEANIVKMKQRLADAEKNRGKRIDEQVQRLLDGKPLQRPEGAPRRGGRPDRGE